MKKNTCLLVGLLAFAGLSCDHNEYVIEMTPRGEVLERTLTVRRISDKPQDFPAGELEAISKLYPKKLPSVDPNRHGFVGEFKGRTPTDVGGAGTYACYATSMGSTFAYVERFRGNDDFAGALEARLKAVDRFIGLLTGWAQKEFGKSPDFPKLKRVLDEDLRKDLKNAAAHLFLASFAERSTVGRPDAQAARTLQEELAARFAQRIVEREYLDPDALPTLFREAQGWGSGSTIVGILGTALVRKARVADKGILDRLDELVRKPDEFEKSMSAYLREADPNFRRRMEEWEERKKQDPAATQPSHDIFAPLWGTAFDFDLGGVADDGLKVSLVTGARPSETNGQWDPTTGKVSWSRMLPGRDANSTVPTICYAVWANPDEKFQKDRFVKVILEGEELMKYCIWRKGLTPKEGQEWEAMLKTLRPDEASIAKVSAFRFSHEPPRPTTEPATQPHRCADGGIEVITGALRAATQPAPTTKTGGP